MNIGQVLDEITESLEFAAKNRRPEILPAREIAKIALEIAIGRLITEDSESEEFFTIQQLEQRIEQLIDREQ